MERLQICWLLFDFAAISSFWVVYLALVLLAFFVHNYQFHVKIVEFSYPSFLPFLFLLDILYLNKMSCGLIKLSVNI